MMDILSGLAIFGSSAFYIAIVAAIGEAAVLIMIAYFTGGAIWPIMSSRMRKSPLLLVIRNDGQAKFISGSYYGGFLKTKSGIWQFHPKKDSNYRFYGSVLSLAEESSSTTYPLSVVKSAHALREMGFNTYEDFEKYLENQVEEEKDVQKELEGREEEN